MVRSTRAGSGREASSGPTYVNRDFRRDLVVAVERPGSPPQFANGRLVFVANIPPKGVWHTCLKWLPVTRSHRRLVTLPCNAVDAPLRKLVRPHASPT